MSRARLLAIALVLLPALCLAEPKLTLADLDVLHAPMVEGLTPAPAAVDTRTPRLGRIFLEAAGGAGAGLLFGFAGGIGGLLVACPSGLNHSPPCLRGLAYGALVGVALSAAPGAFLTGHLLRGGGSFIPTFVGGLVGIGATLLLAPIAPAILPLLVFGLPVIGSVAGYELSASLHAASGPPVNVAPAAVDRGGGWILSASF